MRGFEDPKGNWIWGMEPYNPTMAAELDESKFVSRPAYRVSKSAFIDAYVGKMLQSGAVVYSTAGGKLVPLRMDDPCDAWPYAHPRPAEPFGEETVWYRGWELGFSFQAEYWGGDGWIAYKGGCDLGAPEVRSATYSGCLDAIDEQEDE